VSVRLEELRVERGDFRLELSARLERGATAIYGPSGAGKSTLLETIAGLERPRGGRVELDGRTLDDGRVHVPPRDRRVGWVPQDGALFSHLTVRGNILYGVRGGAPAGLARTLEVFELVPLLERRIGGLSGGELRRVALARALLVEPRLLLLDEPLAGLDRSRRERILPYLERLRAEFDVPLLYVSHEPDEIVALCDEMLVLDQGRLVAQGPPAAVLA
jgi:molybdate transport system ATP-binding protein